MTVIPNDKPDDGLQKSHAQVWVALIGALASIAVAAVTAKYQARPAASNELDQRVSQVRDLEHVVAKAKQDAGALRLLPVGTVIASLLSVTQMTDEGGGLWVPADGRNCLSEWKYTQLTGETKLPDLRGMFLRGVNDSDQGARHDGKQDPEDQRRPGSEQLDSVGGHTHALAMKAVAFKQGGGGDFAGNIFSEGGFNKTVNDAVTQQSPPGENRPRNVAIRWFIRVK